MSSYLTTIPELAKFLLDIVESDRDGVMAVTGDTGEGKSVLLLILGMEFSRIAGTAFNPRKNFPYTREEFGTLIDALPERSMIGGDEAVGLFYSRDYHDDEQIALLKKLDRIRYRHLIMAFLIPSLWHLDKHIRDARVRLWIHVDRRKGKGADGFAHAYVFQKTRNPFLMDPWNTKLNVKLFEHGKIDKSPNYMGELVFYDAPRAHYAIYQQVKDAKRRSAELMEWHRATRKKRARGEKLDKEVTA